MDHSSAGNAGTPGAQARTLSPQTSRRQAPVVHATRLAASRGCMRIFIWSSGLPACIAASDGSWVRQARTLRPVVLTGRHFLIGAGRAPSVAADFPSVALTFPPIALTSPPLRCPETG